MPRRAGELICCVAELEPDGDGLISSRQFGQLKGQLLALWNGTSAVQIEPANRARNESRLTQMIVQSSSRLFEIEHGVADASARRVPAHQHKLDAGSGALAQSAQDFVSRDFATWLSEKDQSVATIFRVCGLICSLSHLVCVHLLGYELVSTVFGLLGLLSGLGIVHGSALLPTDVVSAFVSVSFSSQIWLNQIREYAQQAFGDREYNRIYHAKQWIRNVHPSSGLYVSPYDNNALDAIQ